MTEEQEFSFDLKGYLLIPEVLGNSEIAALKAQIETIRTNPEALLPEKQAYFRDVWVWCQGGPDNGKNLRYED